MKQTDCAVCQELCEHPQAICLAKAELITTETAQRLAALFKIFGDATRIKILQILARREMCVCDLAAVINLGQSAVSHQLRLLRDARLVKYRKDGPTVWYSLNDDHVRTLLSQGLEHIAHS